MDILKHKLPKNTNAAVHYKNNPIRIYLLHIYIKYRNYVNIK